MPSSMSMTWALYPNSTGFGGRLRTEPYQSRHYGVMRWFLDTMYRGAERTYGLRVEVDEPELTGDELAARLSRPVIVLSRHAGPGDSFLLVHQLLSLYHRRPRVVMKAALQLDPAWTSWATGCRTCGSSRARPASTSSPSRSPGWPGAWTSGARWSSSPRAGLDPGPVAPRDQAARARGPPRSGRTGQGYAQPAPA